MSSQPAALDGCGCCDPPVAEHPQPIGNPAGLPAISYRIGTQPAFKERMKAALGRSAELTGLTTRDDSDPAVALVDAWAAVLDVLAFYQERIANEGYLRTAVELASVYALAAEIGYTPNPGAAADVMLAFQMETSPGAPREATIPTGTKVQSLPDPKVKAQTFETVADLDARPEWNTLLPRRTVPQHLSIDGKQATFAGTGTGLKPGDGLLFVGDHRERKPASQHWDFRVLETVSVDTLAVTTTVTWGKPLGHHRTALRVHPERHDLHIFAMKTRAGVFGYNAADWRAMPDTLRTHYDSTGHATQWPNFVIYSPLKTDTIDLDAIYPEAAAAAYVILSLRNYTHLFKIKAKTEAARADFALSGKTTRITLEGTNLANYAGYVRETVVHLQGPDLPLADIQLVNPIQSDSITLDRVVDGLPAGRALIVTGKRARAVVANRVRNLKVLPDDGSAPVPLQPGELLLLTKPYLKLPGGHRTWYVHAPGGVQGTIHGVAGELRWAAALDSDPGIAETATLHRSELIDGSHTRLVLTAPLANCYDRGSLKVSANIAPGTHGETKHEVLGSGDGSQPFQSFPLRQAPLTYVSSSTPSGATTTLSVTVDDVAWTEVPSLFGTGPRDRVYVVRIGADGNVTVEFGDGVTGARLPTGVENVKATYRVGTGTQGMVAADRITLLLTRPMGVRSVDNPVPAGLGADPEQLVDARRNAPQKVVTFDRVVSLTDFEDFARIFAGIAKALAGWVWDGASREVHVTVAGVAGAGVDPGGKTFQHLVAAITDFGDPHQRFKIDTYDPQRFGVEAGIFVEAGRDPATVLADANAALIGAFGFEQRSLAQPVFESEVIAALQGSPGVLAVDLTALYNLAAAKSLEAALGAHRARWENNQLKPAQLLTIDPASTLLQLLK
jgi:hypothetical protein